MRDYRTTGRQLCRLSPFHMRLHEQAVARATCMAEMLDVGLPYAEIGRRFNTSEQAVKRALKRQGLLKR
jgi:hypothetical protein